MSEETEQVAMAEQAPASEEQTAEEEQKPQDQQQQAPQATSAPSEQKKSVTFENGDMSFDETQAEIDAIKAKAGQARESLRTSQSPTTPISYPTSSMSTSSKSTYSSTQDDLPKSKNMLSHLNSHSAMLNYKVQSARSLVRKQEDLLRNLARMRENMERSESEIGKASDYYTTSSRYQPRRYEYRTDASASRRQVCDTTPRVDDVVRSSAEVEVSVHDILPTVSTNTITVSADPKPISSSSDYKGDDDFEREMAEIRKRVANITKQASETTSPSSRYSSAYDYLYDPTLNSSYLYNNYSSDSYKVPETRYEVNYVAPERTRTTYLSTPTVSLHEKTYGYDDTIAPQNSYANYLMDSLNEYPSISSSQPTDLYDYDTYGSYDTSYLAF